MNVRTSDGATNLIPVGIHRGEKLTRSQRAENTEAVLRGWCLIAGNIAHSLRFGFYQGWDLHPSQLVPRYAATYALFLREQDRMTSRLNSFLENAARARLIGHEFDDIATGLGLLQFFARGRSCGAFTDEDVSAAGLTVEELADGSFSSIMSRRGGLKKERGL
jgi:hypothetical protein